MNKNFSISGAFKIVILLFASLVFIQCEKPDTEGVITIVDAVSKKPVVGASVTLYIDSPEEVGIWFCDGYYKEKVFVTNSSGVINECFEHPALISVKASYTDVTGTYSTKGEGKLNLMEHESTSLTIKMN